MPASRSFASILRRTGPPWLQRAVGGALKGALGSVLDTVVDATAEGVRQRFPHALRPDALGYIGRDRRILRGPAESDAAFAARVLPWWDMHRIRGGPYALLTQLQQYLAGFLDIEIHCVANSGNHHWIDLDGDISRGFIEGWTGDGEYPTKWARIFLILHIEDDVLSFPLLSESGEPILTESGEPILVDVSIYALSDEDRRIFCAVAKEWSAAHIDRIYIRLLPADGILWGYPPDMEWGDPGLTWGGGLGVAWTC